jgi:diguanylate cyclase (GGDEF)-like protein
MNVHARSLCAGRLGETMISLKKYLDSTRISVGESIAVEEADGPRNLLPNDGGQVSASAGMPAAGRTGGAESPLTPVADAYRSALREMGSCSVEACPALGPSLKDGLSHLEEKLRSDVSPATAASAEASVREQLQHWGRLTAAHYRKKTGEVKDLLLAMARTAESVGERDQRCAGQIGEVTARLERIASLDDLVEIRSLIERSAAQLKTSLDRMAAEGRQAIAALEAEVSSYQVKLEEAEELASRDSLTGLRNRAWAEAQIRQRIDKGGSLTVAIVDLDGFKRVNDRYGHLAGDELLRRFARELKTGSRVSDVIGRWGGDEFILVLDCGLAEASPQMERLGAWVCQDYPVQTRGGPTRLKVAASIGLAERRGGENMEAMLARADAAMYARKAAARG